MPADLSKAKANSKGPTLLDVAKKAGVSIATASRVINGLDVVSEEVRERVLRTAANMHYVPHITARNLAKNRANTIGLILPALADNNLLDLIVGVEHAARSAGLHVVITSGPANRGEAIDLLQSIAGRTDGIVVCLPNFDLFEIRSAIPASFPIVDLGERNAYERGGGAMRDFSGGLEATRHLIDQGCRYVVHLGGPEDHHFARARASGYMAAIADADLEPALVVTDLSAEAGGMLSSNCSRSRFILIPCLLPMTGSL